MKEGKKKSRPFQLTHRQYNRKLITSTDVTTPSIRGMNYRIVLSLFFFSRRDIFFSMAQLKKIKRVVNRNLEFFYITRFNCIGASYDVLIFELIVFFSASSSSFTSPKRFRRELQTNFATESSFIAAGTFSAPPSTASLATMLDAS